MVRNTSRLANVCRRWFLLSFWIGLAVIRSRASSRRAGTADALKTDVVIPDSAKNRTDFFRIATSTAYESDRDPVGIWLGFEFERCLLPVVGALRRRFGSCEPSAIDFVRNHDGRRS